MAPNGSSSGSGPPSVLRLSEVMKVNHQRLQSSVWEVQAVTQGRMRCPKHVRPHVRPQCQGKMGQGPGHQAQAQARPAGAW